MTFASGRSSAKSHRERLLGKPPLIPIEQDAGRRRRHRLALRLGTEALLMFDILHYTLLRLGDAAPLRAVARGRGASTRRRDVSVQGSPGECSGHLGGYTECSNGRLVD